MRRSRLVACLTLATLCILFAAVPAAQAPGTSATGAKGEKPLDDEPIVVKPKGGTLETDDKGFQWIDKGGAMLKEGNAGELRADLLEFLKKLEACEKDAKSCAKAYAVRFNLYKVWFEVRETKSGFEWDIPARHKQKSCKFAIDCKDGGIPPEFMTAQVVGRIEAKFTDKSEWVEVVAARFNTK